MVTQPTATSVGQGTEIEYGPDQMAVVMSILAKGAEAYTSDYEQSKKELGQIMPTLIANKQVAPWTKESKGEKVTYGGMDWDMTKPRSSYEELLVQEKVAKMRQERLQGGVAPTREDYMRVTLEQASDMRKEEAPYWGTLSPQELKAKEDAILKRAATLVMQADALYSQPTSSQVAPQTPSKGGGLIQVKDTKTGEVGTVPDTRENRAMLAKDNRYQQV